MIRKLLLSLLFTGVCYFACAQNIQSPEQFLGYKLGEQFTPHYKIIEYFKYVAAHSKNVKLQQYGTTSEGRPLDATPARLASPMDTATGTDRPKKISIVTIINCDIRFSPSGIQREGAGP